MKKLNKQTIASRENGKKGGRPVGTISKQTKISNAIRYEFIKKVKKDADLLYSKALELANGVEIEKSYTNKKGEEKTVIYSQPPSGDMIKWLLDQTMGKATESTKLVDPEGETIPLSTVVEAAINQAYGKKETKNK